MNKQDWIHMMEEMQEIQLFCRKNVRRKRKSEHFSSEELDILSRIALAKEPLTPLLLSQLTGLNKPMISKLIEGLDQKEFLIKQRDEKDRRSYWLRITEKGKQELSDTYRYYLQPIYELRRNLGQETFAELMKLLHKANSIVIDEKKGEID